MFASDDIPDLIMKSLIGTLSDEEKVHLSEWRAEKPENEALYSKLTDPDNLQMEYARWKSIDSAGPLREMKSKIKHRQHPLRILFYAVAGIAAVAVILLLVSRLHRSEKEYNDLLAAYNTGKYVTMIHPGETKATLTTDEGKVFVLGNESEKQAEAFVADKEKKNREAFNNLTIPRGGEYHITLEDGTEVWLNAASSLKYPETFNDLERNVEITGEAYFKVAPDKQRPFIIKTEAQDIIVYGTELNVMSYEEEPFVVTTLVNGSISLRNRNAGDAELILTPGHQASFSRSDGLTSVSSVNTEVVTCWRNGMFVFENQCLDQIMRQLSRWYDFDYEFVTEAAAKTVFMGRMPRYGSFGSVLEILEKSGNLKFEATEDKILISLK